MLANYMRWCKKNAFIMVGVNVASFVVDHAVHMQMRPTVLTNNATVAERYCRSTISPLIPNSAVPNRSALGLGSVIPNQYKCVDFMLNNAYKFDPRRINLLNQS
jgi:hypothetical protein